MPATHVHVGGDPVIAEGDTARQLDAEKSGLENTNGIPYSEDESSRLLYGAKSPGVRRIEIISAQFRTIDKVFFLLSIFLVSYAYGLDLQVRSTYQTQATASYSTHSLLSTVNILRSVIAAAAQPTAAKIADVFGRVELVFISVLFYTVGTIVETFSHGVKAFCAGAVLYQIGYTCISLMVEIIIGDTTSLRSRLVFSFIPASPFIINTWVGGNITSTVLANSSWRWGIGMFAIIFPVSTIPLLITMFFAHRRAKKHAELESYKTPFQALGAKKLLIALFWQLDIIGVILLIAVFALILVPFSIAGGVKKTWQTAHIIAPLVIGILCIPVWIWWEKTCKHPMIPFRLLKDRAVWGAMGIAIMLDFVWELQGSYLYTVLVVAFGESVKSATRISSLYSFVSVLSGTGLGLIVFYVRRLKAFIIFGTCLFLVAFGVLIRFRGGSGGHAGIIGAEFLLGFAGGLFPYPTQANIQSATKHEHLAVITGIFLAAYNIGSAIGGAIAGAIWSQVLPGKLETALGNVTLATSVYGDPFTFATEYALGTPERQAAIGAYQSTQKLLCITGICLCVPLIGFSLVLRDPKLGKEQSLPNAEENIPMEGQLVKKVSNGEAA